MSVALAIHRPSHTSSHSPSGTDTSQAASRAYYPPISLSRGPDLSQYPQTSSSPIRSKAGYMDSSPRGEPSLDDNGQDHVATAAQTPRGSESAPQPAELGPLPPPSVIEVKAERPSSPTATHSSPSMSSSSRRRPQRLDLNTNAQMVPGRPSAPLTAKESGSLSAMQDVAITCLSPGFDTSDPNRRQQMERSRDLAEQQRQIIVARQNKGGPKDLSAAKPGSDLGPPPSSFSKPLGTSRRKAPPSSLAIALGTQPNEPRVIQSAPLGQTFSGFNRSAHPLSRQVLDHSHHHQPPQHAMAYGQHQPSQQPQSYSPHINTPQSATRLPPIQDVFANENLGSSRPSGLQRNHSDGQRPSTSNVSQGLYAPITNTLATHSPLHINSIGADTAPGSQSHRSLPTVRTLNGSPSGKGDSHSSSGQHPGSTHSHGHLRPAEREYRSAEEAVQSMTGGREDLLPKLVHYGGHQPPTPPSPLPPMGYSSLPRPSSAYQEHHPPSNLKVEPGQSREPHSGSARRRPREEFERDLEGIDLDERERERDRDRARERGGGLGFGFGAWTGDGRARRSPETMRRRKEEFMSLCGRAWELLHE